MVPVERIELPTFGLQNRCSTAELNRRIEAMAGPAKLCTGFRSSSAGRISDLLAKGQNLERHFHPVQEKGGLSTAFFAS